MTTLQFGVMINEFLKCSITIIYMYYISCISYLNDSIYDGEAAC